MGGEFVVFDTAGENDEVVEFQFCCELFVFVFVRSGADDKEFEDVTFFGDDFEGFECHRDFFVGDNAADGYEYWFVRF